MVDLVAQILALVPPWTRVYRVQRDIPMPLVTSGVENGNLRELALARMKEKIKKKIIQIVRNHAFLHFFYFFQGTWNKLSRRQDERNWNSRNS